MRSVGLTASAGAVIVAAGRSERLGAHLPKPYLRAGLKSLLEHVLAAFDRATTIGATVVVAAASEMARAERIARRSRKVCAVVPGGRRRQDSVRAGLAALPLECDPVLVHDAARPLIRPRDIDAVALEAARRGAALLAAPVADTLKEAVGADVMRTVDRRFLWRAETPQGFRRSWLDLGFRRAEADDADVTDESMLVERLGRRVRIVSSVEPNFKVTTPADLALVRALLRKGGRR